MMLKPWIFIAAALLTCASQANAGEITEADLKADEIILAKKVLANCQTYQPEVKVFWLIMKRNWKRINGMKSI